MGARGSELAAPRVVVMGVAGSGKSTVGAALAAALGVTFVEGDRLHPAANVAKMAGGEPLDDDDRWPWLARVRAALRQEGGVVVACSALARRYRDLLRQADGTRFVFLDVTRRRGGPPARAATRPLHGRLDGRQPVRGTGAADGRRDRCRDDRRGATGRSGGRRGSRDRWAALDQPAARRWRSVHPPTRSTSLTWTCT